MTSFVLQIHNDDVTLKVFLNSNDEIYIGDDSDDPMMSQYITIPIEDWNAVKNHIDNLIKEIQ